MEDMITEQPEIGEVIGLEKASKEAIESWILEIYWNQYI